MNKLIQQLGVADNFSLKTVVAVEELINHDMIYVYHHLSEGALVDLKFEGTTLTGDPRYAVFYKAFKLGVITVSGIMRSFFENEKELQAEVASMSKDKFMPIKELDIQLGVVAMKKVG